MGFIEARIGKSGFDGLAERLLKGGAWPDEIKPRSLGNALRQLDQGGRQDWIRGADGERLSALAAALKMAETELRDLLADHAATAAGSLVPLVDLPEARPIDLTREPLFPGIPEEVLTPERWSQPLWWEAQGGAGRTLVGRWLEARGLARFVRARDARIALEQMGPGLPLYVELDRPDDLDRLRRERLPPGVKLCVAAPFEPPGVPTRADQIEQERLRQRLGVHTSNEDSREADAWNPGDWIRVRVPPLWTWVEPLLGWVKRRLDSNTALDAHAALRVVEQLQDRLRTPGDLLALCGLIDQWGAETVRSGHDEALLHATELAFRRLPEDNAFRELLTEGRRGPDLLLGLVRQTFRLAEPVVTMADLTEHGLDRATWERLVPADLAPAPDPEAARKLALAAAQARQAIEPTSLLACLQPGPEALVTGLIDAHLLESQGEGRLVFRMRWLLRWAEERHLAHFGDWTVEEIGEALLQVAAWQDVQSRLLAMAQTNTWAPVQRIVAAWRPDDPTYVVALEAAFLATGLGILMGASPPEGLCQQLWDRQRQTLVARLSDHHRLPALLPVEDSGWGTAFDRESWALAAIAITERVASARLSGLDQGLAPWLDDDAREPLRKILAVIWEFWGDRSSRHRAGQALVPWATGAFAMGSRLLDRHGPLYRHPDSSGPPCLMFLPTLLVRRLRGDSVLGAEAWDLSPIPFEVILAEAERHGLSEAQTLSALWKLAAGSGSITGYLENLMEVGDQRAARLWRTCPPELLAQRLSQGRRLQTLPFESLTDEQWMAILEPLRQISLHGDDATRVWRHLPWNLFERLVRERRSWEIMHEATRVMWSQEHDRVRALTREVLPNNVEVAWLLWTMPLDTFLEELEDWLHADAASALYITSRLHAQACRRGPRWRESWAWLRRLKMGGDGLLEAGAAG